MDWRSLFDLFFEGRSLVDDLNDGAIAEINFLRL